MREGGNTRHGFMFVLRVLAFLLAVLCAWTALATLIICVFTIPEAWFMVLVWAAFASLMGLFAFRGIKRPAG